MAKKPFAGSRREKILDWVLALGVIAFILLVAGFLIFGCPWSNQAVADEDPSDDGRVVPYIEGDDLPPFNDEDGRAESWLEVATWATREWDSGRPAPYIAIAEINDMSLEQAAEAVQWQVDREREGKVYLTTVSQSDGRWVINTGPKENTYWIGQTWLSQGFPYLAWDPDNPYLPRKVTEGVNDAGIKGDCFNPIRDICPGDSWPICSGVPWCPPKPISPTPPGEPEKPEKQKPLRNSAPEYTPHHPDTATYFNPDSPGPTISDSDAGEETLRDQDEAVDGDKTPTSGGTPTEGSPPSDNTREDGVVEENPEEEWDTVDESENTSGTFNGNVQ